jgi:protein-disulfide isomerase
LRLVFRHFPLHTIHRHASIAAQAAEAAAAQGKFWEMHELLYANQANLDDSDMTRYAVKLGLELYRFNNDIASRRFARRVEQDHEGGVRSGVKGTPTFFVNGIRYRGERTVEAMIEALEAGARNA